MWLLMGFLIGSQDRQPQRPPGHHHGDWWHHHDLPPGGWHVSGAQPGVEVVETRREPPR